MTRTTTTPTTSTVDLRYATTTGDAGMGKPRLDACEALGRAAGRAWRAAHGARHALTTPHARLGLVLVTEALIAAGGISRPDAALTLDAAEVVGSIASPRRKRPGGPRVVIE